MRASPFLLALSAISGLAHGQDVGPALYSNLANRTGSVLIGGATDSFRSTRVLLDDITLVISSPDQRYVYERAAVTNFNPVAIRVYGFFNVYLDNGPNGGPGDYYSESFGEFDLPASSSSILTFSYLNAPIRPPFNGRAWAGVYFTNVIPTATATVDQLNNIGLDTYGPPTTGTSADRDFLTTKSGRELLQTSPNSPSGSLRTSPFAGAPAANYGLSLNAVPEPTAGIPLALGAFAFLQRRRARFLHGLK